MLLKNYFLHQSDVEFDIENVHENLESNSENGK